MKLIPILFLALVLFSCKKEKDVEPIVENAPIVAPCPLTENTIRYNGNGYITNLTKDSIFLTPEIPVGNSNYCLMKSLEDYSLNLHFYFTGEPTSGYYQVAYEPYVANTNVVYVRMTGFGVEYVPYAFFEHDTVYINNSNGIITASFCDFQFTVGGNSPLAGTHSALVTFHK